MHCVTQYLESDQHILHALLLEAIAGPSVQLELYARFRAGMLRHIAIEEKVLLPAVRRANRGRALARAHDLRIEHAALTSLLVPTPDLALCGEIDMLLQVHEAVEHGPGGVYEECEQVLPAAESQRLLAAAREYRIVPLAPSFDGTRVPRSANEALAAAERALHE